MAMIRLNYPLGCAWNRIIKRKFLIYHDLTFEEGIYCEDIEWNVKLLQKRPAFALCPHVLHVYRQHSKSITKNYQGIAEDFKDVVLRCIKESQLDREPEVAAFLAFQYASLLEFVPYLKHSEQLKVKAVSRIMVFSVDIKARFCQQLLTLFGFWITVRILNLYLNSKRFTERGEKDD